MSTKKRLVLGTRPPAVLQWATSLFDLDFR